MSNELTDRQPQTTETVDDGGEITAGGYQRTLSRRHVTMIAIGVGLFMGAGGCLASAGPARIFSSVIAGVIAFL